jgi:hypothetical protein
MPVRKWTAPVRLGFANPGAAPSLVDLSKQCDRRRGRHCGDRLRERGVNHLVHFDAKGVNGKAAAASRAQGGTRTA